MLVVATVVSERVREWEGLQMVVVAAVRDYYELQLSSPLIISSHCPTLYSVTDYRLAEMHRSTV